MVDICELCLAVALPRRIRGHSSFAFGGKEASFWSPPMGAAAKIDDSDVGARLSRSLLQYRQQKLCEQRVTHLDEINYWRNRDEFDLRLTYCDLRRIGSPWTYVNYLPNTG